MIHANRNREKERERLINRSRRKQRDGKINRNVGIRAINSMKEEKWFERRVVITTSPYVSNLAPSITDRKLSFVPRPFLPSTLSLDLWLLFALSLSHFIHLSFSPSLSLSHSHTPKKQCVCVRVCISLRWEMDWKKLGGCNTCKSYYIWQVEKKCLTLGHEF